MPLSDFKVIEVLGKGSFASVYKVLRKADNKIYALKRAKIHNMSKKDIADAFNEIRFLASIRHKNIVGFLEAFLENNETELCIVMEYCGCGDLNQKVERYKRRRQYIDEDVIWRYLIQALKAMRCLHEHGICHRDLKCANTFIAEDGSIKIGDMNVSKKLKDGLLQTQIGTPYYMAPEIWNNRPYDWSCDIWSVGCMIYELAALRPPFLAETFPELKKAVTSGRYPPLPRKYSESLSRVIASLLRLAPRERPSAEAALSSADLVAKLQLDELAPELFAQQNMVAALQERLHSKLMDTIKVPMILRHVDLPKPCYPDARPHSPTAWTVAEQRSNKAVAIPHTRLQIQTCAPMPPAIAVSQTSDIENTAPIVRSTNIVEAAAFKAPYALKGHSEKPAGVSTHAQAPSLSRYQQQSFVYPSEQVIQNRVGDMPAERGLCLQYQPVAMLVAPDQCGARFAFQPAAPPRQRPEVSLQPPAAPTKPPRANYRPTGRPTAYQLVHPPI